MTIDDKIKDEKLQYDINREAAKISALLSGKIDKYKYLTGEGILPSDQNRITEQAKFTYSPLGKAFEKQIKNKEEENKEDIKSAKGLFPKWTRTNEIKNEIDEIKKWEGKIKRKGLI